jgi:two-component system, sensor histidine kinase YesM
MIFVKPVKKIINYSNNIFTNFNIRKKMFTILFSILLAFSLLSFLIFQIFFYIQNDILKEVAEDILSQVSKNIENEFKKIENLSAIIMTDAKLQDDLKEFVDTEKYYERIVIGNRINERLYKYTFEEKYLQALYILSTNGYEFISDNTLPVIDKTMKSKIIINAKMGEGSHLWFYHENETSPIHLFSTRNIREYKNLSLKVLGTLILGVDIKGIIDNSVKQYTNYKIDLAIFLSKNMVYTSNESFVHDKKVINLSNVEKIPKLITLNNKTYLIAETYSPDKEWLYICMFPYYKITERYFLLNIILIIVYLALFFIIASVGFKFTRSITCPIENLANEMKKIEDVNFYTDMKTIINYKKHDEIGVLYNEFYTMIDKINTLINDNYKKQLIIKDAQFRTLQAQINPHFLYNTLESINWIAKMNKQDEISRMVKSLGNLFRISISRKVVLTIEEQVNLLNDYITIQKIRYEDRLDVSVNVEESVKNFGMPKLILQPIVENSIKYGLEVLTGVCIITIDITKNNNNIDVVITDNGPGMSEEFISNLMEGKIESKGTGLGIKNIDERFKIIYEKTYSFEIKSNIGKGTAIKISIPAWKISDFSEPVKPEENYV